MLIKLYEFQDCIDYKKLKQKMGAKDGDRIRFTLMEKEYIGIIDDTVVLYYDKNNDCIELPLEEFIKIEYELKIPYKDKCAHIDCDKCPLHEIRCNLNGKYRDQTLEEVLDQSITNPKIRAIYRELLEKEV